MKVTAKLRYLRIAPRKVRLVADLIRGKTVEQAQTILNFVRKRATRPLLKLLNSAIANAHHNFQLEKNNLYISEIRVDEGPKLKRWRPRARGQAFEIQKKTSHVTLVLEEIEKKPKKRKVKKEEVKKEEKEKIAKAEEKPKKEIKKPKKPELEIPKPKIEKKGIKRFFRRKAF
jgi:large subunit ribosomal protein L22